MAEITYGIAIYEPATGQCLLDYDQAVFETMSGIKSVIGTLALERAAEHDHDIDSYTMTISSQYASNGSGQLKYQLANHGFARLTLRELAKRNVADSDCVATNALIDYLGGRQGVNSAIARQLGLSGIELVTERLDFPGVNHDQQPFQVGRATMHDFVNYYQTIWSSPRQWQPVSSEHTWHRGLHSLVSKARLFGIPQAAMPPDVSWLHKTGSTVDKQPDNFYMTIMDAGMLRAAGRLLFVAAACTVTQATNQIGCENMVEQDFALRNEAALANFGVSLSPAAIPEFV